jgi:hypothetical protein
MRQSQFVNNIESGLEFVERIGYPVIIRPSFTIGGAGGGIAYNREDLLNTLGRGIYLSPIRQVLIESASSHAPTPSVRVVKPDIMIQVLSSDWQTVQPWGDGNIYRHRSGLRVIVSTADFPDGRDYMHISLSHPDRLPSYDDLKFVKSVFAGDHRYAYQVFPPVDKHISIHPFCLHLWVPLSGELPLPDFTRGGNTI